MGYLVIGLEDDEQAVLASELLPDVVRVKVIRKGAGFRLAIEAPMCVRIGRVKNQSVVAAKSPEADSEPGNDTAASRAAVPAIHGRPSPQAAHIGDAGILKAAGE